MKSLINRFIFCPFLLDINECSSNVPPVCHKNATCSNSEGSYSCQCQNGHFGDGKINCTGTFFFLSYLSLK